MTSSFYSSFHIRDSNNYNNQNLTTTNVLKKDLTLNISDYSKYKLSKQYDALHKKSLEENSKNNVLYEKQKIYNLSMNDIINNSGKVYINLLNDFSKLFFDNTNNNSNTIINDIINIIVKDENLIYIGLLLLVLSFFLWLIDITS
jgi:hypothetical protein